MASCLGLYIEDNLIKYAKVSKEKDETKIDSYGIKFYSNINDAIEQIVQETNSTKTPINVNLVNEDYQYFSMFAQLNKKDLDKAIQMEFEAYCTEKGYNAKKFETRYICSDDEINLERIKIINISENLVDLDKTKSMFNGKKIGMILPVPIAITNVLELNGKENVMIVNLEGNTTITLVHGKYIEEIETLEYGSKQILQNIEMKENSYAKAYDALRNTTIYTSESLENFDESSNEQTKYLEDILPTIYPILEEIQKKISESIEKTDKIYLTGTLSNINNLDLYFQEYLGDTKCEILKPNIINNIKDTNMKEYIEVNSATALAIQGLGKGIKGISFKQEILEMDLKDLFNVKNFKISKNKDKDFFKLNGKATKTEVWTIRGIVFVLIFIILYIIFSKMLINRIEEKKDEVQSVISSIKSEISKMETDTKKLNSKATEYSTLIEQLNTVNGKISDVAESKYLISNLLAQIAMSVDKNVQVVSISNPYDRHIIIEAKSKKYPNLGYFITKLKTNSILLNVVSGGGIKQDDEITVTIEGELP